MNCRLRASSIVISLVAILGGCTWTVRQDESVRELLWPPAAARDKISLRLIVTTKGEGMVSGVTRQGERITVEAYKQSALFNQVGTEESTRALTARVHIGAKAQMDPLWTTLCILTIAVVPCKRTEEISVLTVIQDREMKKIEEIEKNARQTIWEGWLIAAMFPLHFLEHALHDREHLVYDLNRSSIVEANERGAFSAQPEYH